MWIALIKKYWRVSLFKETPANTPYSVLLLGLIAVFFFLLVVVQWTLADIEQQYSVISSILSGVALVLSYSMYTYVLLFLFQQSNRMVQTLTCLLAGHTIVHLCAFPLLLLVPWFAEAKIVEPLILFIGFVYLILTLILTIWQFMVTVHIYKHALGIGYISSLLASIGLLAFNILVVSIWR